MRNENSALDEELGRWVHENEQLRIAVENRGAPPGSAAPPDLSRAAQAEMRALRTQIAEMQRKVKQSLEREKNEADFETIVLEMNEAVQQLEAELAMEKATTSRAERAHQRTREDLVAAQAQLAGAA